MNTPPINGNRIDPPPEKRVLTWLLERTGLVRLVDIANCVLGLQILVPEDHNGQNIWKKATVAIGKNSIIVKLPPVSASGGGGSGSGWFWSDPVELPAAPYPAYSKGAVIHIQSGHGIVTTGIRDAANPAGPLRKSPGSVMAIAIRDVPAETVAGGNPVWNLPKFPMGDSGDWDAAANFWAIIPDPGCINSSM
jgi:hypothetical protein